MLFVRAIDPAAEQRCLPGRIETITEGAFDIRRMITHVGIVDVVVALEDAMAGDG